MARLVRPITDLLLDYRKRWALPAYTHPDDGCSDLAQLCQQPAAFEFPRAHLPTCFHFTGPYTNPASREPIFFPFNKLTGQPLIYASLGTVMK